MIIGDVDTDADPELASSLSAVQRNAIRLQSLIENMMHSSKTNFDDAPLVVSTVDIGHLLGDVVKSMDLGAADSGIEVTLRTDSPAGDLLIDGDINRLEQVFVNLMSNAIKFTPRGGKVTIVARRAHTASDCVEVKVTDTGIGIPLEEFPNVFKRFFRASTATQSAIPGFGIGLSLVQSIVHEHHGTITFDSTVGKGTVFMVTLPTQYISTKPPDETI
jgi:signal transduction histidine kinase